MNDARTREGEVASLWSMTASEKDPKAEGTPPLGEDHWSKARAGENEEALDYYRERSKAPGVEEGGGMRNHYCFECDGVIELEYDSREPAPKTPESCPHCGACAAATSFGEFCFSSPDSCEAWEPRGSGVLLERRSGGRRSHRRVMVC